MYAMHLYQALAFTACAIALIAVIEWRGLHPLLAIVLMASIFGLAAGFPIGFLAKTFGNGFSQWVYSPGVAIIAAALVAGLARSTGASDRLTAVIARCRCLGSSGIAALLGVFAGIGAWPAAAFAVLIPLLQPIGGDAPKRRQTATITLALAISASHGLILVSPVPIATAAILGASWTRLAMIGVPLTLLVVAVGAAWAAWLAADREPLPLLERQPEPPASLPAKRSGSAAVLVAATAIPSLLLMVQSLGDIPSEPLGGGPARELVLGVGRPLVLLLVGVGVMVLGHLRQSLKLLADPTWTERIIANVAGIIMIVGATGGLQRLCQETGMAEQLGELWLGWHPRGFGVLVPFMIAALIKTLQGSSLVAALTTAGMVQPLLLPLGLADDNGKTLAALAIGIGAMTVSHVNDEYFWLVSTSAALSPLRGLAALSVGTLLQGVIAVAVLLAVAGLTAAM